MSFDELKTLADRAKQLNLVALEESEKRRSSQLMAKRRQQYERSLRRAASDSDEDDLEDYTLEETERWEQTKKQKRQNQLDAQTLDYGELAASHYNKQVETIQQVREAEDPVQALIDDLSSTVEARHQRRTVQSSAGYISDANRQFNIRLDRLTKPATHTPWSPLEF